MATQTPNNLGANIAAARRLKPMTQLALAHALGWNGDDAGAQISKFESGAVVPKLDTLLNIAKVLGVEVGSLLK